MTGPRRLVRPRGFTLLEVMVAVAILGLGLTVILSSQAGLLSAIRRVQNETYVTNLARCRMSEIELELEEDGYSLVDQKDSGECCEDEDEPGFSCNWTIETVELPQPASFGEDPEDALDDADDVGSDAIADAATDASIGAESNPLAAISGLEGAQPGEAGGVEGLAGMLGGGMPGGEGGITQMAMGLVYPDLKPMLEASIRKVTVKVNWNEGSKEREFAVVQYVTNPLEGSLNPNADEGLDQLVEGMGIGVEGGGESDGGNP